MEDTKMGEFYLENMGMESEERRFLTGPSSSDRGDTAVTFQNLEFEDEGGRNQVWKWNNGMLECAANGKVLDIDWNFAGTAKYSGEGAPVLAWHEKHGGNNQKFYLENKGDLVMIGRKADLEQGFDGVKTFMCGGQTLTMKGGSVEVEGVWRMVPLQGPLFWWEPMETNGTLPEHALIGGRDGSTEVHIALAEYEEGVKVIGKVHRGTCYIAYNDKELKQDRFSVLCVSPRAQVDWVPMSGGEMPPGAVKGFGRYGEDCVGRGEVNSNAITPGRISPGNNCLLTPWGGYNQLSSYEALVIRGEDVLEEVKKSTSTEPSYWWSPMETKGAVPKHALIGGRDEYADVYIALGEYDEGVKVIGKVSMGTCYIAYNDRELQTDSFSVLCVSPDAKIDWVTVYGGDMPGGALKVGEEYVGRGEIKPDVITPGRISTRVGQTLYDAPGHCLLAPWGGYNELSSFEALVIRGKVVLEEPKKPSEPAYWWEPTEDRLWPQEALVGGKDGSADLYIALAEYEEGVKVIGKVHNSTCYIAYNEQELRQDRFSVLCVSPDAKVDWVTVSGGDMPAWSVKVGNEFVGRGKVNSGESVPGRILPGENCLLAPYGGFNKLKSYEALVIKREGEMASATPGNWILIENVDEAFRIPDGFEKAVLDETVMDNLATNIQDGMKTGKMMFIKKKSQETATVSDATKSGAEWVVVQRNSVGEEFNVPPGYQIVHMDETNFGDYLPQVQHLINPSMASGMEGGLIKFIQKMKI